MTATTLLPPPTQTGTAVIALPPGEDPVATATRLMAGAEGALSSVTLVVENRKSLAALERTCRRLAIAVDSTGPAVRLVVARGDAVQVAREIAERDGATLLS